MKTVRITAVNDDLATRFSWDAAAAFGSTKSDGQATTTEIEDADAIVASYEELPDALRNLGTVL